MPSCQKPLNVPSDSVSMFERPIEEKIVVYVVNVPSEITHIAISSGIDSLSIPADSTPEKFCQNKFWDFLR